MKPHSGCPNLTISVICKIWIFRKCLTVTLLKKIYTLEYNIISIFLFFIKFLLNLNHSFIWIIFHFILFCFHFFFQWPLKGVSPINTVQTVGWHIQSGTINCNILDLFKLKNVLKVLTITPTTNATVITITKQISNYDKTFNNQWPTIRKLIKNKNLFKTKSQLWCNKILYLPEQLFKTNYKSLSAVKLADRQTNSREPPLSAVNRIRIRRYL